MRKKECCYLLLPALIFLAACQTLGQAKESPEIFRDGTACSLIISQLNRVTAISVITADGQTKFFDSISHELIVAPQKTNGKIPVAFVETIVIQIPQGSLLTAVASPFEINEAMLQKLVSAGFDVTHVRQFPKPILENPNATDDNNLVVKQLKLSCFFLSLTSQTIVVK